MLYTRLPKEVLENLGVDTDIIIPYLVIVDVGDDKLTNIPFYRIGGRSMTVSA
ncbi:MAG: hypothetical protein QXF28_07355 [Nitrososphaerota archaeon]